MRPCVVGCLFVTRRLLAMAAQPCVTTAHVSRFQTGGSGDDDVNVQVHLDVADVDASRADAVVVAFHLDPGADFDGDCASGVGGVDVSVDVSVDVDMLMLRL